MKPRRGYKVLCYRCIVVVPVNKFLYVRAGPENVLDARVIAADERSREDCKACGSEGGGSY